MFRLRRDLSQVERWHSALSMHKAFYLLCMICLFSVDQWSKYWVSTHYLLGDSLSLLPGLSVSLMHNTGIAFSFLAQHPWAQDGGILLASCILITILCIWFLRSSRDNPLVLWALTLILSGAFGNIMDRFLHGYVIDFIDVYYDHYHWPIFNIADSCISVGALLLLIDIFRGEKKQCL